MKSTVVKTVPTKNYRFPCVMEYDDEKDKHGKGLIVMFFDESDGVCLFPGASGHPVGTKIKWTHIYQECWTPFSGTITIEV